MTTPLQQARTIWSHMVPHICTCLHWDLMGGIQYPARLDPPAGIKYSQTIIPTYPSVGTASRDEALPLRTQLVKVQRKEKSKRRERKQKKKQNKNENLLGPQAYGVTKHPDNILIPGSRGNKPSRSLPDTIVGVTNPPDTSAQQGGKPPPSPPPSRHSWALTRSQ